MIAAPARETITPHRKSRESRFLGSTHVAFGFRWLSDVCLPDLPTSNYGGPPDIQLISTSWPSIDENDDAQLWYGSPARGEGSWRKVFRLSDGEFFLIRYNDGTDFLIDRTGSRVWCRWKSGRTIQDITTYLYGPVVGFLLRVKGVVCLHASVANIDNCAVAFVGPGGAGKSTMAAALSERGYAIFSDDILALREVDGRIHAVPTYPALRLWPESVDALFGSPDALPRITPTWDKRHLKLASDRFETCGRPLGAAYFFDKRTDDCAQRVQHVQGADRLSWLIGSTYAYQIFDRDMRAYEFGLLSRLASEVPLRLLTPFTNLSRMGELCDLVLQDFQSLPVCGLSIDPDIHRNV
jgi:hypothetical protein